MSGYNGWTNYETWRVNLELLDGLTPDDLGFDLHELDTDDFASTEKFGQALEMYVCELVEDDAKGFALDILHSFLSKVDWDEIAEHMIADAKAEV